MEDNSTSTTTIQAAPAAGGGALLSTNTVQRRLSLPDLTKLKQEWDRREAIQATAQLAPGKLQVRKKEKVDFI